MKIKAGDKVRIVKRKLNEKGDSPEGIAWNRDMDVYNGKVITVGYVAGNWSVRHESWSFSPHWLDLVKGAAKDTQPKFIIQYELDSDPFELFATEKEVRARIAELAEKSDLKRDSIKIYDIKRVRSVKLGTKITIT